MLCWEAGEHALCVQMLLSLSKQHGNHGGFYHSGDPLSPEGYGRALDKTQKRGGKRFLSFSPWILEREEYDETARPLGAVGLSAEAIILAPISSPTHRGFQVCGKAGGHTGRKGDGFPPRVCGIDSRLVSLCG